MILADTSVWIDHFRHSSKALSAVIESDALLCHPVIIGELALGSLRDRRAVLSFLSAQR
jgi:predicted nucleic acid-binding protein